MIKETIEKLKKKENLTDKETALVFTEIMSGRAETQEIAEFLLSLKEKPESVSEITSAARVMRKFSASISPKGDSLVDTCGTGGDLSGTINVSTISAFVATGAGCKVAKHGNRAVSSSCGSADLLEGLGVKIDISKETVEKCIDKIGIGFLFAPLFHASMKYAAEARKAINTRSIFNILGPLTNPAGAPYQVLGVYDAGLVRPIADVLKNLGSKGALVVHGRDGLDEITTTSETFVAELKDGSVKEYAITPEDFGLRRAMKEDIRGGNTEFNSRVALEVLKGNDKGSKRDIVVLNAGAAIYVANLAKDIKDGIEKAKKSIDSGQALEKLEALRQITNEIASGRSFGPRNDKKQ